MNVYFMRHGETDWNTIKRLQGRTDIPLNQNGIDLAAKTSKAVHESGIVFDKILTSPLIRAKKTAELMNVYSKAPLSEDSRIIEFCFGDGEGHTFEEIKTNDRFINLRNWFFAPENYHAEMGAESYEDFFGRLDDFLTTVRQLEKELPAEKAENYNLLIVCHGGVVRGLLKQMLEWSVNDFAKTKIPNCGLNLCKLTNGIFSLEYTAKIFA
ncbi:histidine phosphatase family protein [Treponema sp.]|uniref:histidine phosphatase family protein n=1 Tax=Treponema sp. TaxID=166 RepID=UPI0025FD6DA3|nr:histidine phosphatase family protein [Treponema sp.]MCR5218453.1 histidine phosphatase family protein [Treponema sp.]